MKLCKMLIFGLNDNSQQSVRIHFELAKAFVPTEWIPFQNVLPSFQATCEVQALVVNLEISFRERLTSLFTIVESQGDKG